MRRVSILIAAVFFCATVTTTAMAEQQAEGGDINILEEVRKLSCDIKHDIADLFIVSHQNNELRTLSAEEREQEAISAKTAIDSIKDENCKVEMMDMQRYLPGLEKITLK